MVNAPHVSLKVIVIAHFVLTVWASMLSDFLPTSYIYMNGFILAFGVWALVSNESVDAMLLFLILNVISIVMDIIFLGIFHPVGHAVYGQNSTFRFCLGMAILNLILKPFSSFILYKLYQDRGGQYADFGIPGMPNFTAGGGRGGAYENIDQSVPSNTVESASPHSFTDKSPTGMP